MTREKWGRIIWERTGTGMTWEEAVEAGITGAFLATADELLALVGDGEPVECTCTVEREGHGEGTNNWLFKHCKAHGYLSEEEYKDWRWRGYLHQLMPNKEPKPTDPGIYLAPQREPESRNEYKPWEAEGITELAYYKRAYLEVQREPESHE